MGTSCPACSYLLERWWENRIIIVDVKQYMSNLPETLQASYNKSLLDAILDK